MLFEAWILAYIFAKILRINERLENIEIGPVYLMLKSRRINDLFVDFVKRHRKKLTLFYNIGVLSGIILLVSAEVLLIQNLLVYFIQRPGGGPPAQLLIPGVTVTGATLLKMIPGLILVFLPHELSHKITLHLTNIDVKSVGFLVLFAIPGAFVEPDEEKFRNSDPRLRMKVLAAGSYVNILIALLFMGPVLNPLLYNAMISPLYGPPSGVIITDILPGSALANQSSISEGDVLLKLNGIPIKNIQDVRQIPLSPGDIVLVTYLDLDDGAVYTVNITVGEDPDSPGRGILGYIPANYYPPKIEGLPLYLPSVLYEVLFWIFFLSLNIGIINMLPIYLLDGYGFMDSLLEYFGVVKSKRKVIMLTLTAISLTLLILNLSAHILLRLIT